MANTGLTATSTPKLKLYPWPSRSATSEFGAVHPPPSDTCTFLSCACATGAAAAERLAANTHTHIVLFRMNPSFPALVSEHRTCQRREVLQHALDRRFFTN